MSRVVGGSYFFLRFLMGEVPLQAAREHPAIPLLILTGVPFDFALKSL